MLSAWTRESKRLFKNIGFGNIYVHFNNTKTRLESFHIEDDFVDKKSSPTRYTITYFYKMNKRIELISQREINKIIPLIPYPSICLH